MDKITCSLSENEVKQLIIWHGYNLNDEGKDAMGLENMSERIERINYLNKRIKAGTKENGAKQEPEPAKPEALTVSNESPKWGNG